jgi:hypothetical protein
MGLMLILAFASWFDRVPTRYGAPIALVERRYMVARVCHSLCRLVVVTLAIDSSRD